MIVSKIKARYIPFFNYEYIIMKSNPIKTPDEQLFAAVTSTKSIVADVEAILDQNANVKAVDASGYTALMYATDNYKLTELLIARGADVNAAGKNGRCAAMMAATMSHKESLKLILSYQSLERKDIIKQKAAADVTLNKALVKCLGVDMDKALSSPPLGVLPAIMPPAYLSSSSSLSTSEVTITESAVVQPMEALHIWVRPPAANESKVQGIN
jgi:ankyrin repeat protein